MNYFNNCKTYYFGVFLLRTQQHIMFKRKTLLIVIHVGYMLLCLAPFNSNY